MSDTRMETRPAGDTATTPATRPADPITVLTNAMWDAMIAEGIPSRARRSVISRVLYGHPDGFEIGHPDYRSTGFHDYVGKRAGDG